MLSAPIGNVFTLNHVVANKAGVPEDAETVTFFIKPPVGATVTGPPTAYDGTGMYHYDYEPSVSGTHEARVETTNPDTAAEVTFYVEASNVA